MMGEKLQAVTDAENGQSHAEDARICGGRIRIVDRTWASGEDETNGVMRADFVAGSSARKDNGEDVLFPYAARD
jgi:hypothetical protein